MGRRRTKRYTQVMPTGMRERIQRSGNRYFYLDVGGVPRREIPLGSDYAKALLKRSDLLAPVQSQVPSNISFEWLAQQYARRVVCNKGPKQQQLDLQAIAILRNVIAHSGIQDLAKIEHRSFEFQLLDAARNAGGVKYRYAKSLLRHMLHWAVEQRYLSPSQTSSLTTFHKASKSAKYAESNERADYAVHELLQTLLLHCTPPVAFALQLIRCLRVRRADVLFIELGDIQEDALQLRCQRSPECQSFAMRDQQGKLNSLGRLMAEIDEFRSRKPSKIASPPHSQKKPVPKYLLSDESGRPLLNTDLKKAFAIAREASIKSLIASKRADLAKEMQTFQLDELSPLP
jgi:hypothetical protein